MVGKSKHLISFVGTHDRAMPEQFGQFILNLLEFFSVSAVYGIPYRFSVLNSGPDMSLVCVCEEGWCSTFERPADSVYFSFRSLANIVDVIMEF